MQPILITGIGKRLGLAMARNLMAQGYPLIGTYRSHYDSIDELKAAGAELYRVDLLRNSELNGLIAEVKSKHESLRAIIHNASDWMPERSDTDAAEVFNRMMQIHASVPYQLNLALAPLLQTDEIGSRDIIHISDYVAQKGSKKHIAYAASKAALDNLTLSFAAKLAPGVKVNGIAPALMLFNEQDDTAYRQKALAKALLPKEGGEQEMLAAVEYLMASRYMTGRTLSLDGGRPLK
ncbi:dihydromonapterin reductase [Shewanella carassii]|uniref:dihydromonapterin reductase n=1 Tax=Shewanella carassii TaxID=1987584 RepID=UPI001BF15195|nr:dihydromonapterin reductase [Shewanella carassii]BCV67737.1 dihydromonapterin reductase [Shewanella carassii]